MYTIQIGQARIKVIFTIRSVHISEVFTMRGLTVVSGIPYQNFKESQCAFSGNWGREFCDV